MQGALTAVFEGRRAAFTTSQGDGFAAAKEHGGALGDGAERGEVEHHAVAHREDVSLHGALHDVAPQAHAIILAQRHGPPRRVHPPHHQPRAPERLQQHGVAQRDVHPRDAPALPAGRAHHHHADHATSIIAVCSVAAICAQVALRAKARA